MAKCERERERSDSSEMSRVQDVVHARESKVAAAAAAVAAAQQQAAHQLALAQQGNGHRGGGGGSGGGGGGGGLKISTYFAMLKNNELQ